MVSHQLSNIISAGVSKGASHRVIMVASDNQGQMPHNQIEGTVNTAVRGEQQYEEIPFFSNSGAQGTATDD
ncbi:hypothetical protein Y032_0039g110 [Ancylostoma ceylanicum]|uniref:Uncharacterized protein n=1 Tax=Ancylostoma ceylanicum TaxID=53326 RepID=A0A016UH67_9BILA|nr:hypothetical protein Y032_0039g110 [Ancylostoma ceylanicum]